MIELPARQLIAQPIRTVLLQPRTAMATLLAVAVQLFTVLPIPFLIRQIFDGSIPDGDRKGLVVAGSAVIVLFIIGAVFSVLMHRRLTQLAEATSRAVRQRLLERVYELSAADLHRYGNDNLFDLLLHETNRVSGALAVVLSDLAPAVVMVAGLSLVLLITDWLLFAVSVLFAPLMILMNWALTSRIHERQVDLNTSRRNYSSGVTRTLTLMPLTRVSDASANEIKRQNGHSSQLELTSVSHSLLTKLYTASQQSVVITAALVTLVVGGLGVIDGRISFGTLLSFYAGIALIRPPLDRIVHARPTITSGRIAIRRFDDLFDRTINSPYTGSDLVDFKGAISIDGVEFGYDRDNTVLGPVTFAIKPGELTVLTGPNGSGKSTLVDLICGFYRPDRGSIAAEGVPLERLDIASIRRRTGVVFQDPYILDGSISENLRFGLENVDQAAVDAACRLSLFDETLALLPDGEATLLGANAHVLSGGQAQRLAIARALVRQPALLLLDEPTNHLDVLTLERTVENLSALEQAPSIVIVTHDQRVVESADQVVELPHHDLRDKGGKAIVRQVRHA